MSRNLDYLADILSEARLLLEHLQGRTRVDLDADPMLQAAVLWRLAVIGEAARRIPVEDRAAFANLPWRGMVTMRNVLIHQYDAIDLDIVWDTLSNDVPGLVASLEQLLGNRGG